MERHDFFSLAGEPPIQRRHAILTWPSKACPGGRSGSWRGALNGRSISPSMSSRSTEKVLFCAISNRPARRFHLTRDELKTQVHRELERLERVVRELQALYKDVGEGPATLREKAAAGALLASFYMGVENILKRISRYYEMDLPSSERWHVELFERFTEPAAGPLPVLFDASLVPQMDAFRRFRHVVHHGYEFDLEWDRMQRGLQQAAPTLSAFRSRVEDVL